MILQESFSLPEASLIAIHASYKSDVTQLVKEPVLYVTPAPIKAPTWAPSTALNRGERYQHLIIRHMLVFHSGPNKPYATFLLSCSFFTRIAYTQPAVLMFKEVVKETLCQELLLCSRTLVREANTNVASEQVLVQLKQT